MIPPNEYRARIVQAFAFAEREGRDPIETARTFFGPVDHMDDSFAAACWRSMGPDLMAHAAATIPDEELRPAIDECKALYERMAAKLESERNQAPIH
mgnify:CR=1 FL=1